jgi:hypothetical protein
MTSSTLAADQALDEFRAAVKAREAFGPVVGAARLVDRSGGRADIGVRRVALATLDMLAYAPNALPPELAALPPVKPGSRPVAGLA